MTYQNRSLLVIILLVIAIVIAGVVGSWLRPNLRVGPDLAKDYERHQAMEIPVELALAKAGQDAKNGRHKEAAYMYLTVAGAQDALEAAEIGTVARSQGSVTRPSPAELSALNEFSLCGTDYHGTYLRFLEVKYPSWKPAESR